MHLVFVILKKINFFEVNRNSASLYILKGMESLGVNTEDYDKFGI